MSKSAVVKSVNLPAQPLPGQPIEDQSFKLTSPAVGTPAWKQEVNQRLAAHRTRRGGPQEEADQASDGSQRSASSRAAEAAARVAARYAKAPSYKQLLAGEARAVVRAAGAAAEAARNAQAAAQAVLTGLEFGPHPEAPWEPEAQSNPSSKAAEPAKRAAAPIPQPLSQQAAPARWQDEPPAEALTAAELAWREYEAIHGPQTFPSTPQHAGAKARWEEDLPVASSHHSSSDDWADMRLHPSPQEREQYGQQFDPNASAAAGRAIISHDPVSEATVQPMQPIAANLIEFPKELVAARKARPRLAEGPYYEAANDSPQLNIFEVDPELLAPPIYLSDTHNDVAPPEWASIQLNHRADRAEDPNSQASALPWYAEERFQNLSETESAYLEEMAQPERSPSQFAASLASDTQALYSSQIANSPSVVQSVAGFAKVAVNSIAAAKASSTAVATQVKDSKAAAWESIAKLKTVTSKVVESPAQIALSVAPMSDRILAALVDGALVTLAFAAAAVIVVASTDHPPAGRIALIASIFGLLLFVVLYQFLFFSYAEEGTPGMRYARIALCSFEDDNPDREQMRKRIPAMLLSALPAGLGFAWALVDGDRLTLHDRITRTYQRKY